MHGLMKLLTNVLVENNSDLIKMELSEIICNNDHETLKLMYSLLHRVEDGVKPIVNGNTILLFIQLYIVLLLQKWRGECLHAESLS